MVKKKIVKVGNQEYLVIGDKAIPISGYKVIGGKRIPIIEADAKEIKHPDGRQDVIVKVPTFKIKGRVK